MATIKASVAGGKWSETAAWEGGVVPGSGDDVFLEAGAGNITIAAAAACRSLNCTGYAGTLKHEGFTLSVGDATAGSGNVALKLVAGMTYTLTSSSANSKIEFVSTSTTEQTIETGGQTVGPLTFNGTNGKWKLGAAINCGGALGITRGTFNSNEQTITCQSFNCSNSNIRTVTLNNSTIGLTRTSGNAWTAELTSNLTFSATGSTIKILDTGAGEKTFIGGGKTYGTLVIVSGGTGPVLVGASNSNTFSRLKIEGSGPKTIKLGEGKTQTFPEIEGSGSAANLITVESTGAGATTISYTGTVSVDYWKFKNIHATGGTKFYAGTHSENVGGNEGITFTAPSGKPTGIIGAAAALVAESVQATLNAGGKTTTFHFEYVTDAQFKIDEWTSATKTANQELTGAENKEVSAQLVGLVAATKYHYRVVAENSEGTFTSGEQTLTPSAGATLWLPV